MLSVEWILSASSGLTIEQRGVLLSVLPFLKNDKLPLSEKIADEIGVDARYIDYVLQELEQSGAVSRQLNGWSVVDDSNMASVGMMSSAQWGELFHSQFWPNWCPGGKKGKAAAVRAWQKIYKSTPAKSRLASAMVLLCDEIVEGARRYAALMASPNAPMMKYPEGWLTGRRWEDEITVSDFAGKQADAPKSLSDRYRASRQAMAQVEMPISAKNAGVFSLPHDAAPAISYAPPVAVVVKKEPEAEPEDDFGALAL